MTDRQIIVVDTETTGLRGDAVILELAAVKLSTGEEMRIVPRVIQEQLAKAEPDALRINRYYERGVYRDVPSAGENDAAYRQLREWLSGSTLAGSNPAFDARLLARHQWTDSGQGFNCLHTFCDVWHHRLLDLSAYAAGVLGLPPTELPGLHKVCELLSVTNEDEHSALGDARATAECFRKLIALNSQGGTSA